MIQFKNLMLLIIVLLTVCDYNSTKLLKVFISFDSSDVKVASADTNILVVKKDSIVCIDYGDLKSWEDIAEKYNYDFKIYDRWYRLVFSTNDVNASWDGTYKDAPAPLDAYIYLIKFRGKDDKEYTQNGTVMLLK